MRSETRLLSADSLGRQLKVRMIAFPTTSKPTRGSALRLATVDHAYTVLDYLEPHITSAAQQNSISFSCWLLIPLIFIPCMPRVVSLGRYLQRHLMDSVHIGRGSHNSMKYVMW